MKRMFAEAEIQENRDTLEQKPMILPMAHTSLAIDYKITTILQSNLIICVELGVMGLFDWIE